MNVPPPIQSFPNIDQWVSFAQDGRVNLFSGRVELGQGVRTALLQIAADELDVELDMLDLTQGHTDLSPAEGPTVGSLSITFGGQSLRIAASAARMVMLKYAAELLQSTRDELTVKGGAILRHGVETGLSYASLSSQVALNVPALDHASPKPAADRAIAGASVARVDLLSRLTGTYFLHDLTLDGMWHGRVIQPPTLGAIARNIQDITLEDGMELVQNGQFLAVIGPDEYKTITECNRVANLIDWDRPETIPTHPIDGLDGLISQTETLYDYAAPVVGHRTIRATLTKPTLAHASIGPSCAVAQWSLSSSGQENHLTVWAHSQNVFALRLSLAEILGFPADRITVIFAPGAGCYGHNSSDDVALDAALMARGSHRPIRALWQRQDEFLHAPLSPAMKTTMTATLDESGKIIGFDAMVISPPHSTRPVGQEEPNLRAQQFMENPIPMGPGNDAPQPQGGADRNAVPGYNIPNVRVERLRPKIVPYRPSAMRGLGAFTNVIALEQLMESCAEAAGQDSIVYRLAHLTDQRAIDVIRAVDALTGPKQRTDGTGYGMGYAQYKNSAGYLACIARVEVTDEVRVTDVWAVGDVGEAINPDGTINQIEGGIIQAISWALKEDIAFADGAVVTQSWDDYPILKFSEVPHITTKLIGPQDAPPLGAGEISSGPAGAAVVNAVRDALSFLPDRLPLSRSALISMLS